MDMDERNAMTIVVALHNSQCIQMLMCRSKLQLSTVENGESLRFMLDYLQNFEENLVKCPKVDVSPRLGAYPNQITA